MSWICEFCSTSNMDKTVECFVCGQKRSMESVREERAQLRTAKFKKLSKELRDNLYSILKKAFVIDVTVMAIIILLMIISRIRNESPESIYVSFRYLLTIFRNRLRTCLKLNLDAMLERILSFPIKHLQYSVMFTLGKLESSLQGLLKNLKEVVSYTKEHILKSYRLCVHGLFPYIIRKIMKAYSTLSEYLK